MVLKSCCSCVSVKTGTIVIGCLSLVAVMVHFIMTSITISKLDWIEINRKYSTDVQAMIEPLFAFVYCSIILSGIICVVMIVGVFLRISSYIFPWLGLNFGGIIIYISFSCGYIVYLMNTRSIGEVFGAQLLITVFLGLQMYQFMVVYSYYRELVAEKSQQTRPNDGIIIEPSPNNPYRIMQ